MEEREKRIEERKKRIKMRKRRKLKIVFFLIFTGLLIYFFYFLKIKTINFLWNSDIFKLKKIEIYPESIRSLIAQIIEIETDKNLLFLDIDNIREKIMTLPEIEDCKILKIYPSTLRINVKVRKPWACVIVENEKYVIDKKGKILPSSDFENLLIIKGLKINENKKEIEEANKIEILNEIEKWYNHFNISSYFKIKELDISDLNKIVISNGGKKIFVSSENIKGKMEVLARVLKNVKNDFEYIDTRFKNFYIKFKND